MRNANRTRRYWLPFDNWLNFNDFKELEVYQCNHNYYRYSCYIALLETQFGRRNIQRFPHHERWRQRKRGGAIHVQAALYGQRIGRYWTGVAFHCSRRCSSVVTSLLHLYQTHLSVCLSVSDRFRRYINHVNFARLCRAYARSSTRRALTVACHVII